MVGLVVVCWRAKGCEYMWSGGASGCWVLGAVGFGLGAMGVGEVERGLHLLGMGPAAQHHLYTQAYNITPNEQKQKRQRGRTDAETPFPDKPRVNA